MDDESLRKLVELVGATTMAAVPIVARGEFLGLVTAGAEHDESQLSADGLLEGRVDMALAGARRAGAGLALAFLDLDEFKRVNDELGHDVRLRGHRAVDRPAPRGGETTTAVC